MRLSKFFVIGLAVMILLLGGCGGKSVPDVSTRGLIDSQYDELAKYLTTAGVQVYGTSRCSACQYQKGLFGDSWQYINYIECLAEDGRGQTKICQDAEIRAYPTWEFPQGKKIKGAMSPEKLSQEVDFKIDK